MSLSHAVALTALCSLLAAGAFLVWNDLRSEDGVNAYVGSRACANCHAEIVDAWFDSAHRKMMRRVDEPEALLAHWSDTEADPAFSIEDAVWVIGSKWEQQFMGHDGTGETLLPGAWSEERQAWMKVGWDGWQVPDPLARCHGCHTVGLDTQTGHFVEPGIGCESCHGPGEWHSKTEGSSTLHAGLDADTCGQCHNRGQSKSGEFFFPVGFQPGDKLAEYFEAIRPDFLQNSAQWWGTGRERDRHQEFEAWNAGGHSKAAESIGTGYDGRFGPVNEDCRNCHTADGALGRTLQMKTAGSRDEGITCAVCHNVHGNLDQPRMQCGDCHTNGAFHHDVQLAEVHVPCPAEANVQCVDCHMPVTVKIGGELQLRSHGPGITEPAEGARFEAPSSCTNAGCHSADDPQWLQAEFDRFYKQKLPASGATTVAP